MFGPTLTDGCRAFSHDIICHFSLLCLLSIPFDLFRIDQFDGSVVFEAQYTCWVFLEVLLHVEYFDNCLQLSGLLGECLLKMNVIVFKLFLEIFEQGHMLLLHRVRNFLVIQGFDR